MILFTIPLLCAISSVQGTFWGGCCNQYGSYGSYGGYGGSYGSDPSYGGSYGGYGSSYGSVGSYPGQMPNMPYSSSLPQPFGGSGSYIIWYPHALEYVDRRWQEYYQDKHRYRPSYGNFMKREDELYKIKVQRRDPKNLDDGDATQYQPRGTYAKFGGYGSQQGYDNSPSPYSPRSSNEGSGNYGNQQDYGNSAPSYPPGSSGGMPSNYGNQQEPPQDYNRNFGGSQLPRNPGNEGTDSMTEAGTIPISSPLDSTAGGATEVAASSSRNLGRFRSEADDRMLLEDRRKRRH